MKKGFTLIELLAVIVVIALISLIAFPSIINQFSKSRGNMSGASNETIMTAAELYLDNNVNLQKYKVDTNFCITLEVLVKNGLLKEPIKNIETGKNYDLATNAVQVTYHADTRIIKDGKIGGLTSLDCAERITS